MVAESDNTVVFGGRHCFPPITVAAELRSVGAERDGRERLEAVIPGVPPVTAWRLPNSVPPPLAGWISFDAGVRVEGWDPTRGAFGRSPRAGRPSSQRRARVD